MEAGGLSPAALLLTALRGQAQSQGCECQRGAGMKQCNKGRKRVFFIPDHMRDRGTRGATPKLITAVGLPVSHAPLCAKHGV